MDKLEGSLAKINSLVGSLTSEHTVSGVLTQQVKTLSAKLSSTATLTGTLTSEGTLSGTLTLQTIDDSAYSIYDGDTVVIPTTSDQTLETANKLVQSDILVKEIPTYETSNDYGVSFIIAS